MSRTTRKRIRWDMDNTWLDRNARDDKGRCDCCGNTWQKMYNRRERYQAKQAIANGHEPTRIRADWY